MQKEIERSRLSVDLPLELHIRLNKVVGRWRIKGRLYEKITEDLVRILEGLDSEQQAMFIAYILQGELKLEDWNKDAKKSKEKTK